MSIDIQHPKIDIRDVLAAARRFAEDLHAEPDMPSSVEVYQVGILQSEYTLLAVEHNRLIDLYREAVGDTLDYRAITLRLAKGTVMRGDGLYPIPIECNAALDRIIANGDGTSVYSDDEPDFSDEDVYTIAQSIATDPIAMRRRFARDMVTELNSGILNGNVAG